MVDLDELERLVKQMAPGPWAEIEGHPYLFCNARGPKPWNHDIVGRFDYASADVDRKAIAELRNAAEELIRDARRWREVDALMSNSGAEMSINSGGWALLKHAMKEQS